MEFERSWTAEILPAAPLIRPARQFVWPMRIAGEEDALARGALLIMVRPRSQPPYLVTCARGFHDPAMPTAVFSCPNQDEICAVAGGYAYVADVHRAETCVQVGLKPVVEVHAAGGLLLFVGFHTIVGWGREGLAWQTAKLSWEGIRIVSVSDMEMRGFGWDLRQDVEVEFSVDLRTGKHEGGGFQR